MPCLDERTIRKYIAERLDEAEIGKVRQHLADCEACQMAVERLSGETPDYTGEGMEPEVRDRVFEPFFTTESSGTGLGLYVARELVESNNAQINYFAARPHGSIFKIFFVREQNHTE